MNLRIYEIYGLVMPPQRLAQRKLSWHLPCRSACPYASWTPNRPQDAGTVCEEFVKALEKVVRQPSDSRCALISPVVCALKRF